MAEIEKQNSSIGNAEMAQTLCPVCDDAGAEYFLRAGAAPLPDSRPMPPNLEAGKILIDQLEMIQEKTRGNLSSQEAAILDDALKNVRLAFVEVSGGTPASMMPKSNLPEFPMEGEDELDLPEAASAPAAEKAKPAAAPQEPAGAVPEAENKKKFTKSYG